MHPYSPAETASSLWAPPTDADRSLALSRGRITRIDSFHTKSDVGHWLGLTVVAGLPMLLLMRHAARRSRHRVRHECSRNTFDGSRGSCRPRPCPRRVAADPDAGGRRHYQPTFQH